MQKIHIFSTYVKKLKNMHLTRVGNCGSGGCSEHISHILHILREYAYFAYYAYIWQVHHILHIFAYVAYVCMYVCMYVYVLHVLQYLNIYSAFWLQNTFYLTRKKTSTSIQHWMMSLQMSLRHCHCHQPLPLDAEQICARQCRLLEGPITKLCCKQ